MTGRDWLRAMVIRDRRRAKPGSLVTSGRELGAAETEQLRERFRAAVAPVRPRTPPLPTIDPPGCTCESAIYSRCYCRARA